MSTATAFCGQARTRQPLRRGRSAHGRRRVQGSILVQTAIALSLLVILLIGIELGYMFYLKRQMQTAVDLAALAAAQVLEPSSCVLAGNAAVANAALNLPASVALVTGDVTCGRWDPVVNAPPQYFAAPAAGQPFNAVSIVMNRTPPLLLPSIPGNLPRVIEVRATAARRLARAALTVRSTLVSVDSTRAPLLNAVLGGMLGSSVSLDAVGYTGLVNTNIQLLAYLDQLALDLGIAAGHYDDVLAARTSVGTLLQSAVTVLQRQGSAAQVAITALNTLRLAALAGPVQSPVQLGQLLGVQGGTPAAALALDLQVFQLAEGLVQLANGQNGLVATVPLSVPGLINLTTRVRVIEPPQMSAVGDPQLASLAPTGPNRISVRTAQLRTLITVELPALNLVTSVTNALTAASAPLIATLNDVLTLNLSNVLACLVVCSNQRISDPVLLPNARLDLNLDAGSGESHVTGYSCTTTKSLTAQTQTAAAVLRIGQLGDTVAHAVSAVFPPVTQPHSTTAPVVSAVPLLDIGAKLCTKVALVLMTCGARQPYYGGGLGLMGTVPVAGSSATQSFANPPDVGQPPLYQTVSSQNLVNSLSATLNGGASLIAPIAATGSANGGSAAVMTALTNVLSSLIGALGSVVSGVLAPLLDPLVNLLLHDVLGLSLAQSEVGAQLSCTQGAQLVY